MALLHISEPNQTPNPHNRRIAIGIDLGTTHSLVAAVRSSIAECLPDQYGNNLLPSVVGYCADGSRLYGLNALLATHTDNINYKDLTVVSSVKRLMGKTCKDITHIHNLPYTLTDQNGMAHLCTVQGNKSPIEISAEILAVLRQRAEDTFNADIYGAVITVPAYFDDAQRQATKDAAKIAGLQVLRLINEPTAAAIAYGLDNAAEGIYLVYDLGGGTFDISVLRMSTGVFEVIATGGDTTLGGDDFDIALAEAVLKQANLPQLANCSIPQRQTVLNTIRAAKHRLSEIDTVEVILLQHTCHITKQFFEHCVAHLIDRTLHITQCVLKDAGYTLSDIKELITVGGSTRIPAIRTALEQLLKKLPFTNLNPDEVVAMGAAIQAHQLAGYTLKGNDPLLLLDVTPLSLGIEMMGGIVERIIPRNSTLPCAYAQYFTTYQDNQTALAIHVLQGERDTVEHCRSLARFELRNIPHMVAGAAKICVTFTVDTDGLLTVSALETTSGVTASIDIKPSYGLNDATISKMLQDGFLTASIDMSERSLRLAIVNGHRLVAATESALSIDGHLLNELDIKAIQAAIKHLNTTLFEKQSTIAIEQAIQTLNQVTETFAEIRMSHSINYALKGQSITNT